MKPLDVQVGGDHYKKFKIQPIEYAEANRLPPCYAAISKYLARYKGKNGAQDVEKCIHYIDLWRDLSFYNPLPLYGVINWRIPTIKFIDANSAFEEIRRTSDIYLMLSKIANEETTHADALRILNDSQLMIKQLHHEILNGLV